MSEENVKALAASYERFNATGEPTWELLAHEIEWRVIDPAPQQVYRGHDGVRQWVRDVREIFDSFRLEPDELIDAGDRVVVTARVRGRGKGSDAEVEMPVVSVWTFERNLAVRVDTYQDRAEALAAAGLAR